MNTLFRACYLRDGLPRGVTFPAKDIIEAMEFADNWESRTKLPILTIKMLGGSINPGKPVEHITNRITREGWPTSIAFSHNVVRREHGK